MKVVITGGSGFIGRALLRRLSGEQHDGPGAFLPANDRLDISVLGSSAASVEALARDYPMFTIGGPWPQGGDALDGLLRDADVLLHMAWSSMPSTAATDPARDVRENVEAGLALLDRAAAADVRAVVFLSSGGTVYGEAQFLPITEAHPLAPVMQYGVTKLAFEQQLQQHAALHGYRHVILRPGNVYGNTSVGDRPQGVVEHWLQRAMAGEVLEVWNELTLVRDYVFIDDMVDVLRAVLFEPRLSGAYNVGTGIGTSLQGLLGLIEGITRNSIRIATRPVPIRAVAANVLDSTRLGRELGVVPGTELEPGLRKLLDRAKRKG